MKEMELSAEAREVAERFMQLEPGLQQAILTLLRALPTRGKTLSGAELVELIKSFPKEVAEEIEQALREAVEVAPR
ncbi:MAG: hypothetical protein ABDI19_08025 [Armatimonadota bacterium]